MGLFDIFSNDSAEKARDMANAGVTAGYGQLSDMFGQGRDALTTNYGNASNLYNGLLSSSSTGANAYGDASGANGAAGLQRAMDTFKNSGQYGNYGFALDQGLQALQRQHAAAGNLASGGADTDAMNYATGLANQTYSNYLTGLSPYLNLNANAVSGAAGVDTGLGNALSSSFQGQGTAANTAQTAIGNNNAGAEMNNYKVGANLWNGLTGGLNFIGGGGLTNAVNAGKSLFSAFA